MIKEKQVWQRIYDDPCGIEIVRFVGYAGVQYRDWSVKLQELIEKYGRRAESASWHLIFFEGQHRTNVSPLEKVELRAEVRKLSRGLLGTDPKDPLFYFWKFGPPNLMGQDAEKWEAEYRAKLKAEQQTKKEEPAQRPEPPKEPAAEEHTKEEEDLPASEPGIGPEGYARQAKEKNKRGLLCMLRDARRKLAHHGRHSFMGKEARKEIEAAEAEVKARGMEVPAEGQETAQWDKKPKEGQ